MSPFPSTTLTCLLALLIPQVSATVGVLDIDNLLQPTLQPPSTPFAPTKDPWSHEPHCTKSTSLATLGQKFCVYTTNTTGPHGLSLIFRPRSATEATQYLNDNPLHSFLTQKEAQRLYVRGQPWKIVDIPGKAKGVVATRRIEQYETFMLDQAAVVMDMDAENALDSAQNRRLLKRAVDQLRVPSRIRDLSAAHAGSEGSDGKEEEEEEEEEGRLEESIMKTNAFGSTVAEVSTRALYPLISRVNHACNPNSFVLFSRAGVSLAIKAYRAIEPGEEITISYLLLGLPSKQRAHLLSRWGFNCSCALCTLPADERTASDLRRTLITRNEAKILELAEAYDLDAAIALGEESVEMIKEEQNWSLLTDEYAMLAMLWLEKGDRETAEKYGKMTHRLLADLGFLGVGEERESWRLEQVLESIGGLGGKGVSWKKSPLRG
ncbi:SET domain-containing protein [Decorospora gaudefroyi]|uniref:SET domain-containing protein n=1 Tax=Decorospora gaudefroyi TaxID=184978 RepID=A0A6A5K0Q7_9PLEO|nr:SET domain-containing protein [Decorospora gaudefroyi]